MKENNFLPKIIGKQVVKLDTSDSNKKQRYEQSIVINRQESDSLMGRLPHLRPVCPDFESF